MIKHNLLILGSHNNNPDDRKLKRSEVRPVQILFKDGTLKPLNFFNDWGKVGVSAITWLEDEPSEIFINTDAQMHRMHLETRIHKPIELGRVNDIHDIHFIGNTLWISNTEFDEAIGFDPQKSRVEERISLDDFRVQLDNLDTNDYEEVKDRFHCNQVFEIMLGIVAH